MPEINLNSNSVLLQSVHCSDMYEYDHRDVSHLIRICIDNIKS